VRRRDVLNQITSVLFVAAASAYNSTNAALGFVRNNALGPLSRGTADGFRSAGGLVACFMFGGWETRGPPYNPSPWYWINRYAPSRLPKGSQPIKGRLPRWKLRDSGRGRKSAVASDANLPKSISRQIDTAAGKVLISSTLAPSYFSTNEIKAVSLQFEVSNGKLLSASITCKACDIKRPSLEIVSVRSDETSYNGRELIIDLSKLGSDMVIISWEIDLQFYPDTRVNLCDDVDVVPTPLYKSTLNELRGLPSDEDSTSIEYLRLAESSGINAFLMCAFWDGSRSRNHLSNRSMVKCSENSQTKTALYFDTTASEPLKNEKDLDAFVDYTMQFMDSSGYWKLDGRPILGFHGNKELLNFFSQCGQVNNENIIESCRTAMIALREKCDAKLGQRGAVLLLSGSGAAHPDLIGHYQHPALLEFLGFDAVTTYNQFSSYQKHAFNSVQQPNGMMRGTGYVSGRWPADPSEMRFEDLAEVYRRAGEWITQESGSKLRYWVPGIAGWDTSPWSYKEIRSNSPCQEGCEPTSQQFFSHLCDIRDLALQVSRQNGLAPIISLYAWDEFGEGGYLCPTEGEEFSKLSVVKEVFGS